MECMPSYEFVEIEENGAIPHEDDISEEIVSLNKETYENEITWAVYIALALSPEEGEVCKEYKKGKKKAHPDRGCYHIEYKLLPGDIEVVKLDLLLCGPVAKLYKEEQSKIITAWTEAGQTWVGWTQDFNVKVNRALAIQLLHHKITVHIWNHRDKLFSQAHFESQRALRLAQDLTDDTRDRMIHISLETPLLSDHLKAELNPLAITIDSATSMPSTPVPFHILEEKCMPVYCQYKFHNLKMHRTSYEKHGDKMYFRDVNVIFTGLLNPQDLHAFLSGPPMRIEIHDRDKKQDDKTPVGLNCGFDGIAASFSSCAGLKSDPTRVSLNCCLCCTKDNSKFLNLRNQPTARFNPSQEEKDSATASGFVGHLLSDPERKSGPQSQTPALRKDSTLTPLEAKSAGLSTVFTYLHWDMSENWRISDTLTLFHSLSILLATTAAVNSIQGMVTGLSGATHALPITNAQGNRHQAIINIKMVQQSTDSRRTEMVTIILSTPPKRKRGTARRGRCTKQMYYHSVLREILTAISVRPPQESQQITVFSWHPDLVKHGLNISHKHRFLTKSSEDTDQQTIVRGSQLYVQIKLLFLPPQQLQLLLQSMLLSQKPLPSHKIGGLGLSLHCIFLTPSCAYTTAIGQRRIYRWSRWFNGALCQSMCDIRNSWHLQEPFICLLHKVPPDVDKATGLSVLPGHYIDANSELKARIKLACPLNFSNNNGSTISSCEALFGRVVCIFDHNNFAVMDKLRQEILKNNAEVFELGSHTLENTENVLSNYTTYFKHSQAPDLDFVSGFHLVDKKTQIVVVEGLRHKAVKKLRETVAMKLSGSKEEQVIVLYNSKLPFFKRIYDTLDLSLTPIILPVSLETILMEPLIYVKGTIPQLCLQCLLRLQQLCQVRSLTDGVQHNVFPSADMIQSLSRQYKTSIQQWKQVLVIDQRDEQILIPIDSQSTSQTADTKEDIHCHINKHYDTFRKLRFYPGIRIQEKCMRTALVNRSQSIRRLKTADYTPVHNYSIQTFNTNVLNKEWLQRQMAKLPGRWFTYSQEYYSGIVEPREYTVTTRTKQSPPDPAAVFTLKDQVPVLEAKVPSAKCGYRYVAHHKTWNSGLRRPEMHPKAPDQARVEELRKPWKENIFHGNILKPPLSRDPWCWSQRSQDFQLYRKAPPFFSTWPVRVHLDGISLQEKRTLAAKAQHRRESSTGPLPGFKCHMADTDKFHNLLKDEPQKYSLRKPGMILKPVPHLSVISQPLWRCDRCTKELCSGPGAPHGL
ncbi:uncharacterized protein cfap92 [Boleophthalmus pectinirostris]|uniref:uncharacterized protein cfap92 n=1 Tax=Boleophthalmus pectinirostris TaxID=150288 RepID=UPI002432405C|nr:uncharacterized protein cfap92 [Boleophthalmus pectinirostris]